MSKVEAWVATYPGGERFIGETLESLWEQGLEPHVINDARLPHEKWNEAIERCTADYLVLPHHDDVFLPAWSSELSAYLDAHPSAVAVFSLDYLIDEQGKRIGQTYPAWDAKDEYTFKDLFDLTIRHGNVLRCETVMFNRRVLGEMRFPDRTISGTAHDTQFWFELAAKHPVGIVMKPLVKYRVHPESDTQKNVVGGGKATDHLRAMLYASTLRPQDIEFSHVIGLTRALEHHQQLEEANRVRARQANGCELLVCHEPPDVAGTGVVVAHRVRTLNEGADGPIRYYVYPVQGKEAEIGWLAGCPVVKCPTEGFGDLITNLAPSKVEYHHLLRWPLEILNAPVKEKELWLHDSFLWCARYHSVDKDGNVCNEPSPKKCAECSGEAMEFIEKKKAFLVEALPGMNRAIANSNYTARYAVENLGVPCEVVNPTGAPLIPYPRKKRVGYFGGFGTVKGTPVLLKAWRILDKERKNPKIIFRAGDYIRDEMYDPRPGTIIRVKDPKYTQVMHVPEAQLLMFCDVPAEWTNGRALAGFDDVLVMGGYRRDDLPALCNLVDLAVVPSVNESYGLVARELESLGVPVIKTNAGGMEAEVSGPATQGISRPPYGVI